MLFGGASPMKGASEPRPSSSSAALSLWLSSAALSLAKAPSSRSNSRLPSTTKAWPPCSVRSRCTSGERGRVSARVAIGEKTTGAGPLDWSRTTSGFLNTTDNELQDLLPLLEEIVIAEIEPAIAVVWKIGPSALALHPVVAAARPVIGGDDVDVVRAAGSPVVAGAFAIIVLPGGAQALAELAWLGQRLGQDRKALQHPAKLSLVEDAAHFEADQLRFN